jgi:hypothetical protein
LLKLSRGQLKSDATRAESRFRLSAKRTNPFKSPGASVQSATGSRGVRISGSNAGYTMFRGSAKSTSYSIRQFPLHLSSRASPYAITFQLESTECDMRKRIIQLCPFYMLLVLAISSNNCIKDFSIETWILLGFYEP